MRPRTAQSIVAEVRELMKRYGVTYISFCDDLFMVSEARTKDLCDAFLTAGLGINWYCNGRLNFASKEILQLMKRAGCVFVNYGIEAMDDRILKNMNKALTIEQIVRGVENTLAVGISPGLNIIFGNIGEDRETLNKGVAFLLKYDDASQLRTIRPVTPYPGSPLYYDAIDKGLLKDCEDFYERKHINSDLLTVNFTGMSDIDFHQSLLEANKALLANHFKKKLQRAVEQSESLYIKKNAAFRGFRQT